MARGGYRPGAGRRRKVKAVEPALPVPEIKQEIKADPGKDRSPLEYALAVINDPQAGADRRDRMAIAALPYTQARIADRPPSKKEQAVIEAGSAGSGTDWGDDLIPSARLN
jgi:hypothetical protein